MNMDKKTLDEIFLSVKRDDIFLFTLSTRGSLREIVFDDDQNQMDFVVDKVTSIIVINISTS